MTHTFALLDVYHDLGDDECFSLGLQQTEMKSPLFWHKPLANGVLLIAFGPELMHDSMTPRICTEKICDF